MTKPIARDPIYRRRRFETEIIELCVRWYITYRLSYRDLVAMMAERGLAVSHTTIFAVGDPVRTGVRNTLEPTGPKGALILAGGRDVHLGAGKVALPLPRRR